MVGSGGSEGGSWYCCCRNILEWRYHGRPDKLRADTIPAPLNPAHIYLHRPIILDHRPARNPLVSGRWL